MVQDQAATLSSWDGWCVAYPWWASPWWASAVMPENSETGVSMNVA